MVADQLKSVDWTARRATYAGSVGQDVLAEVLDRVALIL